ncbi:MAG: HlyD family efflux transporter periplasmic adaptor subunit [Gammaproteobacteria bacterium]|nr:HlyD family efflux transporter periplasmic adaptor subunit [Gammaproteobacteria bacterium]
MSLFRPEVAAERARSNWGSVIVTKAPALRWASIALLLACCIGAGLVLRLDYARKVQVAGYLEPAGGIAEVTAPLAGQVAVLHVREGTPVRRGQPLLALELGRLDENGVPLQALEAEHLRGMIRRLDELSEAQAERHRAELSSVRQEIVHLDGERRGLQEELTVAGERQALLGRAEARLERLSGQGLAARAEFDRRRQETLAARQSSSQLQRALAGNRARADLKRAALARLDRDFNVQQLRMEQERAGLERRLQQARDEYRTTIVAPRDGIAAFLQFGQGDRVVADQVLMTVAPQASEFELVLLADTASAPRLAVGNEVRFRVLGAERDGDPLGAAVIREISRTPQKPYRLVSWITVDGAVFRARAEVVEYPEKLRFRHGVRVDAFVVTTSRALWRWLVEPLRSALEAL